MLTLLVTLLVLSFSSSVLSSVIPSPIENTESLGAAFLAALLCSAVVSVPLVATRMKRPAELTPSAALIAVVCLVLSAAGYLAVLYLMYNEEGNPLLVLTSQTPTDTLAAEPGEFAPITGVSRLLAFLLICLATAYYEEGLFRVLLQRGAEAFGKPRALTPFYAALAVSALFGLLHVTGVFSSPMTPYVAVQAFLKFLQGFLFGLIMTGLLKKSGSFVFIVGLHACYDLLLFFPYALSFGVFPLSYCSDSLSATLALALAVVILVPAAIGAARSLRRR